MNQRVLRLVVHYLGGAYHGFQSQPAAASVQQTLEEGLSELRGQPQRIHGGSRTDAGVHARGQCISFKTFSALPCAAFVRGLQHFLPDDLRIVSAEEVDPSFHARWSSLGKLYHYLLNPHETQRLLLDPVSWFYPDRLDLPAMNQACAFLVGKHDFSSFRSSGCGSKHAVRTMYFAGFDVVPAGPWGINAEVVRFSIAGDAFLKQMVRSLVGTLVEVGHGALSVEQFAEVLAAGDRCAAGKTAPARGLVLEEIFYTEERRLEVIEHFRRLGLPALADPTALPRR